MVTNVTYQVRTCGMIYVYQNFWKQADSSSLANFLRTGRG